MSRTNTAKAAARRGAAAPEPPARSGPRSLRAAKEELTRRHILDAAEKVFADGGYAQARMQDIAREAGLSLATLYQLYPGKRELHRSVLLERDREMMAEVLRQPALAAGQGLSIVPLLGVMQGHLRFLLAHPDYLRMILQEGHAWYQPAAQPTADEQALWAQGLQLMTAVFEHGMKAGELIRANPADQARMLIALQQARLASWVADGMRDSHEVVIARIQADFVRQFCRPELARKLLDADGAALNERTRQDLQPAG